MNARDAPLLLLRDGEGNAYLLPAALLQAHRVPAERRAAVLAVLRGAEAAEVSAYNFWGDAAAWRESLRASAAPNVPAGAFLGALHYPGTTDEPDAQTTEGAMSMTTEQSQPQPVIAVTGPDGACYAVPFAALAQYRVPAEQQAAFAQSVTQATGAGGEQGEVSGYMWEQVQTGVSGWGATPVFSTVWVPNPAPVVPAAPAPTLAPIYNSGGAGHHKGSYYGGPTATG